MFDQIYIQIILGVVTVVGSVYAVRMEAKSRLGGLNKEVIGLQDRKITLLTVALAEANKRIGDLEATVKVLSEVKVKRSRTSSSSSVSGRGVEE